MDTLESDLRQKLSVLGFDPSLVNLLPQSEELSQDEEIFMWLSEALEVIIKDRGFGSADGFEKYEYDEYCDDSELETILEERLQQLSYQYDALSKVKTPPARVSEGRYDWPRKEKSLECQDAAHKFGDALLEFLSIVKTFRPTDMNDKQIIEYFAREEEFTRHVKDWTLKNLSSLPCKREAKIESRQATVRLLSRTLLSVESRLLDSEIKAQEGRCTDGQDLSEEQLTEAKKELENLNKNVIPVLRDGYELLETLPAVVADCEEEAEEMAYSVAVLERGVSLMMEQVARCFLFELLLEEKALRDDMQVSILTHAMENELLASKREYEEWKARQAEEVRQRTNLAEDANSYESARTAPEVSRFAGLKHDDFNDDKAAQIVVDSEAKTNALGDAIPYNSLQPWIVRLENMLFDDTGKLYTKRDELEGILLEAEAKTKRLNDLIAQIEKEYHSEKEAVECDGIRSFERSLWIDFFSNPEKLKEIVKEAQKTLLD